MNQSNDPLISEVRTAQLLHESPTVEQYKSDIMAKRPESYLGKSLHGYYERVCGTVRDDILSFNWLTKGDLSIESEGFLCASQEQILSTRAMMQVYSQGSSMCRLCGEHLETVEHLISGCSQLAGQQYKTRHDHVAS